MSADQLPETISDPPLPLFPRREQKRKTRTGRTAGAGPCGRDSGALPGDGRAVISWHEQGVDVGVAERLLARAGVNDQGRAVRRHPDRWLPSVSTSLIFGCSWSSLK